LKRAICWRRFSFSASISALGFCLSSPEMNRPRNPLKRFAIR